MRTKISIVFVKCARCDRTIASTNSPITGATNPNRTLCRRCATDDEKRAADLAVIGHIAQQEQNNAKP